MIKIVIFIALICAASATFDRSDFNGKSVPFHQLNDVGDQWTSKLCNNPTIAQLLVTKVQQFITTLQKNGSFAGVLADHSQAVAYITNNDNTALLSSNCIQYFNGLHNVLKLEKGNEGQPGIYEESARRQLIEIIQSVIGHQGSNLQG